MINYAIGDSKLGRVLVAESEAGICALLLGDSSEQLEEDLSTRFPTEEKRRSDGAIASEVISFVENPTEPLTTSLDLRGTPFEKTVWEALRAIPPGATATYGEIARRIGRPLATRAVARACGANPVAVAIPCHRVVRADGSLSGYRWGVERKRALLEMEREAAGASGARTK